MRKLSFVLFLVSAVGFSSLAAQQTVADQFKAPINDRIGLFFDATAKKDWLGVLNLTYDSLFNLIPKEQMLTLFEQMESEGMQINMGKFVIKDFVGQVDANKQHFINLNYQMEMELTFSGPSFSDDNVMGYMKTSFETTYGAENVTFDKEASSFQIKADKNLYAIAPVNSQEWKFVENNLEQQIILEQIIPAPVRTAFDK